MTADFLYDFGSPNAYLAWRVLPGIEERTGTKFTLRPVLLGGLFKLTGNQSPMAAFAAIPAKLAYQRREMERFVARHGLSRFAMNPHFPVNTLGAMRGAVAADAEGVLPAYSEAMFAAMWEQGLDLADPPVLARAIADAGLPAERLFAAAQQQPVKDRLIADTNAAAARGVFGLPTLIVDGELYFGKDRLDEVEFVLAGARTAA